MQHKYKKYERINIFADYIVALANAVSKKRISIDVAKKMIDKIVAGNLNEQT